MGWKPPTTYISDLFWGEQGERRSYHNWLLMIRAFGYSSMSYSECVCVCVCVGVGVGVGVGVVWVWVWVWVWVCVWVELLKRSKTCTTLSVQHILIYFLNLWFWIRVWNFCARMKNFLAFCILLGSRGARPPVMTLPNKASHWRGSRVWSTLCTCNLVEFDFNMVNFVETLVMRVSASLVCVSSCWCLLN